MLLNRPFVLNGILMLNWQLGVVSVCGGMKIEEASNSTESDQSPAPKVTPSLMSTIFGAFFGPSRQQPLKFCDCNCGQSNLREYRQVDNQTEDTVRIVGGNETQPNIYPWMAQLSYFNQFFCGGALINERFVLTAAHCTNRFLRMMIKVTLGAHNRCGNNPNQWSSYISWADLPPFGLYPTMGQDIALLRLDFPAPINQFIRPICLPETSNSDYTGTMAIVAGWGLTKENGRFSSCTLRDVKLPIMSNEDCFQNSNLKNISRFLDSEYMMCAGYKHGTADSCQGDSGGPLFVQRADNRFEIVGVVSWGIGCARPNFPGVYTRVTKHIEWIRQNAREGCFCRN